MLAPPQLVLSQQIRKNRSMTGLFFVKHHFRCMLSSSDSFCAFCRGGVERRELTHVWRYSALKIILNRSKGRKKNRMKKKEAK